MGKGLSPLVNVLGSIGAGIVAVMMLVTVVDVGGRRLFNQPLFGSMDLSSFMMVIVVFFSITHCELTKGHITIDLVVSRLKKRSQDIINTIAYLIFLVTFGWMTWELSHHAVEVWHNHIVSYTLKIPTAPFVFIAAFGCALLSLLVLMHLLLFLAEALKK